MKTIYIYYIFFLCKQYPSTVLRFERMKCLFLLCIWWLLCSSFWIKYTNVCQLRWLEFYFRPFDSFECRPSECVYVCVFLCVRLCLCACCNACYFIYERESTLNKYPTNAIGYIAKQRVYWECLSVRATCVCVCVCVRYEHAFQLVVYIPTHLCWCWCDGPLAMYVCMSLFFLAACCICICMLSNKCVQIETVSQQWKTMFTNVKLVHTHIQSQPSNDSMPKSHRSNTRSPYAHTHIHAGRHSILVYLSKFSNVSRSSAIIVQYNVIEV